MCRPGRGTREGADDVGDEKITFSFGKNWEEFIRTSFSEERVAIAGAHLLGFLGMPDLAGRYFLDVGCGSGLHSLAALRAGAERVVSFDIDEHSVKTAATLREREGSPPRWQILHGSVLDARFLAGLDRADIVYSWGVLHHTGAMWDAVRNAAGLMRDDALFYLALYTTTPASGYWLEVKKRYNRASPARKRWMEWRYVLHHAVLPDLRQLRDPTRRMREYRKSRGMSFMTDVRDWLGGYPYEDAKIEEVVRFCRSSLGLELVDIATGEANTEYLLRKR
jgi:2-polyprenyl-3-methyl-5-hydroxy-6-metoxy-1,4-benzoquinol methylase